MTWLGSADYLAVALLAFAAELAFWAIRSLYRWRRHHPPSHRKIRKLQATTGAWTRGAAVSTPASSLTPAPGPPATLPGAGPQHRTETPRSGEEARVSFPPTADTGPQHRATTAHPPLAQPLPGSGGPAQRPVDVDAPDDSASTGYQPRNSGDRMGHESGAPDPLAGAPVRGAA